MSRDQLLHIARAHLAEARRRRINPACPQRGFVATLLALTAAARRQAAASLIAPARPAQLELFA